MTTVTNPTPQRRLRGHLPPRPSERAALTPAHQIALAARLTPRDRWLARMLHEHRTLTSTQITQLAFGARGSHSRLLELYRWRIVDRFQPFVTSGTLPMHYVLDIAGAAMIATENGVGAKDIEYRHDRAVEIAHSLRLAHTVAVNGLFTALVAVARHSGEDGRAVTAWWSEARCGRYFGEHVRPDAYGRWREPDNGESREVEFFLEYDFGTEALGKVAAKLSGYQRLAAATGVTTPVLFWFPTTARERAARATFAAWLQTTAPTPTQVFLPIATTASDLAPGGLQGPGAGAPDSPAGARWLPLTSDTPRRVRLAHLATVWPTARRPTRHTETAETAETAETGQVQAARTSDTDVPHTHPGMMPPDPMPPCPAEYHPGEQITAEAETVTGAA